MSRFLRIVSIPGMLIVSSLGPAYAQSVPAPFDRLEQRWRDAMHEMDLPGMAVAVVQGDRVVYAQGFGVRDLAPEKPFTPDTSCYIASSTKPFVALAILQLVDAGKVRLDAPVKQYLPRFELPTKEWSERLTVRDLLCHRYGLRNPIITLAEAYTGEWDDDFYYREMKQTEIVGKWEYSNLHYTIAGRIIQAVTGQTWQDYLRDHIFEPLGMEHTTAYASKMYGFDNVALPLVKNDGGGAWDVSPLRKSDSTMHAAGGLGSSARDLGQWLRLNLNGGAVDGRRLVSEAALDEMLTPHTEPSTRFFRFGRERMGLSWYLGTYKDELLVHHFGGYIGYHAHVSFMPEHKIGVAVLANSGGEGSMLVHQVASDVYDTLLNLPGDDFLPRLIERTHKIESREAKERAERAPLPDGPLTLSKPLDDYVGTYTSDRWGTLRIERAGDTLAGHFGNLPFTLHPDKTDQLILAYPMGREILTVWYGDDGSIVEIRVASYGPHIMTFTKSD